MSAVDTLHAYLGFALMIGAMSLAGVLVCVSEEAEDGEEKEVR
jgi:hypothetical protein